MKTHQWFGMKLDDSRQYEMHFSQPPKCVSFWSSTLGKVQRTYPSEYMHSQSPVAVFFFF